MGNKFSTRILWLVALAMAVFHLIYVFVPLWSFSRHTIVHVMLALALAQLSLLTKVTTKCKRTLIGLLLLLGFTAVSYVLVEAERLELSFGMGIMTGLDFAAGCIILAVVLVTNYIIWGRIIPILALLAILYIFLGHNIPGALGFPIIGRIDAMAFLGMGIGAGVFGFLIPTSASIIFYFMLFGGVLEVTGALPMFLEIGKWVGRRLRGGAAYTALVGSSLIGTVTGATVANVAFTGQYTIPSMKEQGFTGETAGAVECVASMGGQLLPPIMGAGAFIMAVLTGTNYIEICRMAIVPAFLYYIIATIATTIMIRSYGMPAVRYQVDKRLIFERLPVFIIPLAILVYFLVIRYSPSFAITAALFSCIAVSLILKSTRPSLKNLLKGFVKGATMGAEMAVVIMAVAIIAQVAITTGLGPKLTKVMMSVTGGVAPLGLFMMMVIALFLGLGMPTVAAYTIVAIIVVPALAVLGVDKFGAHFFAFYFAILAAVTPPVAAGAIVASRIAGSNFWRCSIQAFKLALPLFTIPFAIVNQPQLLDFPFIGMAGLLMVLASLLVSWASGMLLYRSFIVKLDSLELALCFLSVGALLAYIAVEANYIFLVASISMLTVVSFKQVMRQKTQAATNDR